MAVVNADTGRLSRRAGGDGSELHVLRGPSKWRTPASHGLRSAILNGDLAGALVIPVGYTDAVLANNAEADLRTGICGGSSWRTGRAGRPEMTCRKRFYVCSALRRPPGSQQYAPGGMSFADSASRKAFLEDAASAALECVERPAGHHRRGGARWTAIAGGRAQQRLRAVVPGQLTLQFGISGVMSSAILFVPPSVKKRTLFQRLLSYGDTPLRDRGGQAARGLCPHLRPDAASDRFRPTRLRPALLQSPGSPAAAQRRLSAHGRLHGGWLVGAIARDE